MVSVKLLDVDTTCEGGAVGGGDTWQKEEMSRVYLHAILTPDGWSTASWRPDKDGVDATIRKGAIMIDTQLKCTQALRKLDDRFAFDLDVKTYDKLRAAERSVPGYLIVMVVPKDVQEWTSFHQEQLLFRCSAYYACIQDMPPVTTKTTTVIHLPFNDRLDSKALETMYAHSVRHCFGERKGFAA